MSQRTVGIDHASEHGIELTANDEKIRLYVGLNICL